MPRMWLFVLFSSVIWAQTAAPPDFSGAWKMNPARSVFPKNSKPASELLVIKCSPTDIEFDYNVDGRHSAHAYKIDHKERSMPEMPNGSLVGKAYWKNATLVVETRVLLKMNDPSFNNTEIMHMKSNWTLSDDGLVLTDKSDDPKRVIVYEKQ